MDSLAVDQPITIDKLVYNFCFNGKKLNYYQHNYSWDPLSKDQIPRNVRIIIRKIIEKSVKSVVPTLIPLPPTCDNDLVIFRCYIGDVDNFKTSGEKLWIKEWHKEFYNIKASINDETFLDVYQKIKDDIDLLIMIGDHNKNLMMNAAKEYLKQPHEIPRDMRLLTLSCNTGCQTKPMEEKRHDTSLPIPPKSIIFTDDTFMDYKAAALDSIHIYNHKIADNLAQIATYQKAIKDLTIYLQTNSEKMQLVND